jgi:hypothetical protein
MCQTLALNERVRMQFREVFGEPDLRVVEEDNHWSIKPGAHHAAINILLNDQEPNEPRVWVFNPYVKNDGVMRRIIRDEGDLESIIRDIQEQVMRAAEPSRS